MRALLAILGLFLLAVPRPLLADDYGDARDIRAIRHDAPLLLARTALLNHHDPKNVTIANVVVAKDAALADWRMSNDVSGIIALLRLHGVWTDVAQDWKTSDSWIVDFTKPLDDPGDLRGDVLGPTSNLLSRLGFEPDFVSVAAHHDPVVLAANAAEKVYFRVHPKARRDPGLTIEPYVACPPPPGFVMVYCDGSLADLSGRVRLAFAPGNYGATSPVAEFHEREPTVGESTLTPHGDAFYYFDVALRGGALVTFTSGSRVDVWFPYVLDPALRYSLTLGFAQSPIGPIDGTLVNNTLTFELPAFSAQPGVMLMAEIDGD